MKKREHGRKLAGTEIIIILDKKVDGDGYRP